MGSKREKNEYRLFIHEGSFKMRKSESKREKERKENNEQKTSG